MYMLHLISNFSKYTYLYIEDLIFFFYLGVKIYDNFLFSISLLHVLIYEQNNIVDLLVNEKISHKFTPPVKQSININGAKLLGNSLPIPPPVFNSIHFPRFVYLIRYNETFKEYKYQGLKMSFEDYRHNVE